MSLFGSEENLESKSKIFPNKMALVTTLIIGILVGVALTHYVIEPFFTQNPNTLLSECKASLSLVNQEIAQCLHSLSVAQSQKP